MNAFLQFIAGLLILICIPVVVIIFFVILNAITIVFNNIKWIIFEQRFNHSNNQKTFIITENNYKNQFQLFVNANLVSLTSYHINEPDEIFDQKYVSLFALETFRKFEKHGFMKYLLSKIFEYVNNVLKIDYIILSVYVNNFRALKLYKNAGFEVLKYNTEDEPYFVMIKKLN